MDINFIIALSTMGGLGFIFAGALAAADRKLRVDENPLIGEVNEVLPNANCGACGFAGCYDFAVNLVEGKAKVNGCPVGGQDTADAVAQILGLESISAVKMKARILCKGGNAEAVKKSADYIGPLKCSVAAMVAGGDKLCVYGCLGGGECVDACQFGALYMNENGLPVIIDELCTGCGLCAKTCPRGVIEMHPENRSFFVFCKNHDDPKTSKKVCSVSCIGCGICARKSDGGVVMIDNLAVINYDKLDISKVPFEKCSTAAVAYLNPFLNKDELKEAV